MPKDSAAIRILPVDPNETELLLKLYVDLFHDREPLTKCMGLSKERMISLARSMYLGSEKNPVAQGGCWMARDDAAAGQAVGFIVCDDPFAAEHASIPDDLTDGEMENLLALQAFLDEVRRPLTEWGTLTSGQYMHIAAIGVAPGYEGCGIATRLLQTALAGAFARGFAFVFAECTSVGSKRCHEKNGFRNLHAVAGDTFAYKGKKPFAGRGLTVFLVGKDSTVMSVDADEY